MAARIYRSRHLPGAVTRRRHASGHLELVMLEVVLDRVGGSAAGCHPGGGQVPAAVTESQRLVLPLLARCLRRAARAGRDTALAGARLRLAGRSSRTRPGFGAAAR